MMVKTGMAGGGMCRGTAAALLGLVSSDDLLLHSTLKRLCGCSDAGGHEAALLAPGAGEAQTRAAEGGARATAEPVQIRRRRVVHGYRREPHRGRAGAGGVGGRACMGLWVMVVECTVGGWAGGWAAGSGPVGSWMCLWVSVCVWV